MLDKFLKFISKNQLFTKKDKLLAAVSGGVDSVVLCDLLHRTGFNFAIAHCNFRLRGKESDGDETFVKALAQKYKVDFYVEHFNTAHYAKKEKISLQMAARILRYEWFGKISPHLTPSPPESEKRGIGETERRKIKRSDSYRITDSPIHPFTYSILLTAHHQNDVLETMLLNLTKGTGIAGLHGIQVKSKLASYFSGTIIRPILFAQKEEILLYAKKKTLKWREDSSNKSNKYQRNLIRNKVIPLLKKINPNLETTIQATVEKVSAVENVFKMYIDKVRKEVLRNDPNEDYIDIKKIKKIESSPNFYFTETLPRQVGISTSFQHATSLQNQNLVPIILSELLKPYNFGYEITLQIINALDSEPGRKFESPTHTLVKDRTELIIIKNFIPSARDTEPRRFSIVKKSQRSFQHGGLKYQISVLKTRDNNFKIREPKHIASLDYDKLKFPLVLRKWKEGDWFCPLGMNKKKKKLSDFLIDEKIPLNLKNKVWVLTSPTEPGSTDGPIIWVINYRIDERFKITEMTKKAYIIAKRK
ncbi:MAG: tRNA lysidine(34) synthetase TilS [Cytophagales bacterium]|nr:tRNA lysidine(34) synthetase TilS [Cytophagales bacterium]